MILAKRIDWNRGWEFTPACDDAFLRGEAVGGTEPVTLPHTCRETPYHYFDESSYQMVCGYRSLLSVPEDWQGKRVFLCVGAAAHFAEVYVDGKKLGEHRCGYTAFRTELTEALVPGQYAWVSIRVDSRETLDQPPFGYVIDYMTYGGLYRDVWLEIAPETYIEDVFVRASVPDAALTGNLAVSRFEGLVESTVTLSGSAEDFFLRQTILRRGEIVTRARRRQDITGKLAETRLTLPGAALWDPEAPQLYTLRTELMRGNEAVDTLSVDFGFRRAEFRADGFYLNGRKFKLVGLNRHQSWPYVGYAMPRSLQRLDADILKNELGLNAVRTSHYPQSPYFLERCDELGLLVFTEIPGWQHIGGSGAWRDQAVRNTEDMVLQYRNHPSIILWGVRINESVDDDALYVRTNEAARRLDPTRPTSGVRCHKKSSFLEDVYAYNDFSHTGDNRGCEKKKDVTPDAKRAYLISEYNGHMFPTKTFDSEEHRLAHALRHAAVLDAAAAQENIAGSFGWCMFDYNTHREFGSGDRVCYHGVTDMFRNKKLAAEVYAVRQDAEPILAVSSSMDIGEHPASNRGRIFVLTNADSVRFYKNGEFIAEFTHRNSPCRHMIRPPIEIDDLIGNALEQKEGFAPLQALYTKDILNHAARFGYGSLPPKLLFKAAWLMLRYGMRLSDATSLYQKYIGDWGGETVEYRFEAVKDGQVVKTVVKAPSTALRLEARPSHTLLREGASWDAALIRLAMRDRNGNVLPFYNDPVTLEAEGPIGIIGPRTTALRGGLGGTFVRTAGGTGPAALIVTAEGAPPVRIDFIVEKEDAHD